MSITALVEADFDPPRVKVTTTTGGTVWRTVGGVKTVVRGDVEAGVVYDYECPQETPVVYSDAADVADAVELPNVGLWMVPAADPLKGVQVRVTDDGFPGWGRAAVDSIAEPPGRALPIVVSFRRQSRRGSMTLFVLDLEEFAALSACLDVVGPVFLSAPSDYWPLFGLVDWVSCGDINEEPFKSAEDRKGWAVTVPVTAVGRPDFVVSTALSWADELGTWGEAVGDWASPGAT